MNEIEILYLRFPVHPNIAEIRVGSGVDRIAKQDASYWVHGTTDGPLAGKLIEVPADNVAAVQWKENLATPNTNAT